MRKIRQSSPFNSSLLENNIFHHPANLDKRAADDPMRAAAWVVESSADPENPAKLAGFAVDLFPAGVVAAELRVAVDVSLLFPEEARYLGRATPKRIQEFTAGRLCARRALAELEYTDYPLSMRSDRRPQWPAPIVGSISHVTGICAAVVAPRRQFRAIGLDMEIVGQVTREIWPYICTAEESAWLAKLPEPEQTRCAALIFSAKESFYKCQYELTEQSLEFQDISLDLPSPYLDRGCFALKPHRRIGLLEHKETPWKGRFHFQENLIVTGMVFGA